MGERRRYEPGAFCWVGLATSDPNSAKGFYTSLFGWEAEDLSAGAAGPYTMLRYGGREVASLYRQQPQARAAGAPPHWTYISVGDAAATAAKANDLGGAAVFREPFDVLDHGRVAAIRDPTGAIVSRWQPRSRVGDKLVNDVGALCWNELATTDVERAKTFFAELLGWEYETDDGGCVSIKNAGSLNGGMREQTAQERAFRRTGSRISRLRPPTRPRAKPRSWADAGYCRPPRSTAGGSPGSPTRRAQRSRSSKARPTPNRTAAPDTSGCRSQCQARHPPAGRVTVACTRESSTLAG